MRYFIAALVAVLAAVLAASAYAGKVAYTIAIDQNDSGSVTFTVTRSEATDNDPVIWVANSCDGGSVTAYPALWGLADSLTATTQPFDVAGATHCVAWVTDKPWLGRPGHNPAVEYDVAP